MKRERLDAAKLAVMGRLLSRLAMLSAIPLLCAAILQSQQDASAAAVALQHGEYAAAEKILRAETSAHPDSAWNLSLLGYALDNEKKTQEAEAFHRRAVALSPGSAEILNNFGTHLWTTGQYDKAEAVFTQALAAAPSYFNVLYNLGVMASYAGHYDRAREVLESALSQQPENVDALYHLAAVDEMSKHWEDAVALLARAERLDAKRADVQKLLAVTTTELGALEDAAAAWDRYLALSPGDDAARRERGYTAAKLGKLQEGIAEIHGYVERHPGDKVGYFELGQAERTLDSKLAAQHLGKALDLDPDYAAARAARGGLSYQNGDFPAALKDLEVGAALDPNDSATLDRLGQTYLELDRTADAVRALHRAAELAPSDSKILLHLGRALADSGQTEESKAVMNRFRQLGPEQKVVVPGGLVSYLGLTTDERRAEYRARVEKAVREHPEDAATQLEYLKVVLGGGDPDLAATVVKRIVELKPASNMLADAGHALLEAGRFDLSRDLLRQAAASGPGTPGVQFDLAMATFRAEGAASGARAGLEMLDRIPDSQRDGEYYFARAQLLEACGKSSESAAALDDAVRASSNRPELGVRAAAFLISKGRGTEALRLIENAISAQPESRELMLMKAATLEWNGRTQDATNEIDRIQRQWPEWSSVWAARGIILARHQQFPAALTALQSAAALGASGAETYFCLAKVYDALGRPEDARKARERLPAQGAGANDSLYLSRLFDGSLILASRERER